MALADLARQRIETRLGAVQLWGPAQNPQPNQTIVLAIPGSLAPMEDIATLGESLGLLGALYIMGLPTAAGVQFPAGIMAATSRMVDELAQTTFAGRRMVVMGVSIGAVAAMGVRAANIERVVAVEPPLVTGKLWPLIGPLRSFLERTQVVEAAAFAFEAYGMDLARAESRDYRGVLEGLTRPTDVVVGEIPLAPERTEPRIPSFVDLEERRLLGGHVGVRLHVVAGTGHNVLKDAPRAVRDIVLEACRRASAGTPAYRRGLDEPLLEATPLAARRIQHRGPGSPAFVRALSEINPTAEVVSLDDGRGVELAAGGFDAVAVSGELSASVLAAAAAALVERGHLVARTTRSRVDLEALLAPHALVLREPVNNVEEGVFRAQKLAPGRAPRPALYLESISYSHLLMDIRTRLPNRGLRSDPELCVVTGSPPFNLPRLDRDVPKVVVLQRPAELRPEGWLPFMVRAVRENWIVVMEYDDHPPLIAEVQGRTSSEADLLRFGYVHAVQTSTPPLVEAFRPYNPEVALFANAAFELLSFPEGDRPKRVFYGAALRGRYAVEVAASLGPAIERHPTAEFIVIGDPEVFRALPTKSKRYYGYMSYESYLDLMSQCAVSLSPIEALPMRETKSDAKFLDAGRAGVLTIASPTIYDRTIRHGVNGFLAPTVADWAPLLDNALSDPALRARLARRAWEEVRDERMFAHQVAKRRDWYLDLWVRREDLHEALMTRLPGLRATLAA